MENQLQITVRESDFNGGAILYRGHSLNQAIRVAKRRELLHRLCDSQAELSAVVLAVRRDENEKQVYDRLHGIVYALKGVTDQLFADRTMDCQ